MDLIEVVSEQYAKYEEDSAVLKGLRQRANDLGFATIGEALDLAEGVGG